MPDLVFVTDDPEWDDGFEIHAWSGKDIEALDVICGDTVRDYFDRDDVPDGGGVWILECTYWSNVYDGPWGREYDAGFDFDDVRRPHDWEWDDIVNFGAPIWPVFWTVGRLEEHFAEWNREWELEDSQFSLS